MKILKFSEYAKTATATTTTKIHPKCNKTLINIVKSYYARINNCHWIYWCERGGSLIHWLQNQINANWILCVVCLVGDHISGGVASNIRAKKVVSFGRPYLVCYLPQSYWISIFECHTIQMCAFNQKQQMANGTHSKTIRFFFLNMMFLHISSWERRGGLKWNYMRSGERWKRRRGQRVK